MPHTRKIATVFGATGFIGRQIVHRLANQGYTIKIATRAPERAFFLRPAGMVGQIVPFACNYADETSIAQALAGAEVVINCIGILFEKGKTKNFDAAHVAIPTRIAKAAARAGTRYLVHISALGCQKSAAKYAKTKLQGERAVLQAFPAATILRPSVVFGEDDNFFNMFARMAQNLPALPLIGGGRTRFQPVFVGDVADAAIAALTPSAQGKIFELGGPEVLSLKDIYQRIFIHTGLHCLGVPISFGWARVLAKMLSLMPTPLLTQDQVELLKTDNVVSGSTPTFRDLGISPTALDLVLPRYLVSFRPGGKFGDIENAAA